MAHILLISDNTDFSEDLKMQVQRFAPDFIFKDKMPDLLVVDENIDVYGDFRKKYPSVPMIFLSADFEIAADNLNINIKKPFSLMNFLDVLRAANNKLDNSVDGYLTFNGYELRPNKREIADLKIGKVIKLTEKEVEIIKYLYKMSGHYVSKNDLQRNVWKYNEDVTTHTIETHIYRLRQKVEETTGRRLIVTENGGYMLKQD
ncbi:MAG: response regulator transcription factor [Pseudomonadota bacterium]|nr:response regulator transcription factor [Pseudomonadota bacterium]